MSKREESSWAIKFLLIFFIALSITLMYGVFIVQKDYEIFTNPDGPDTSDYFEE